MTEPAGPICLALSTAADAAGADQQIVARMMAATQPRLDPDVRDTMHERDFGAGVSRSELAERPGRRQDLLTVRRLGCFADVRGRPAPRPAVVSLAYAV